ncbi:MAG: family 43 glycosylhydrolase [Phycisphaerae bacterium]|nr:family 43 glycosylhydrolase [Phycisphaerae bacterium]
MGRTLLNRGYRILIAGFLPVLGLCTNLAPAWQSDNGDGTYTNPVLYADYPDPDIIRVGEHFYMVSTTFADSPGLVVLRSKDLVNWEILSHAASALDMNADYDMVNGRTVYRKGMWASSIRYYNGTFYVVVNPWGASGARVYYAADPAGPWDYHQLDRGAYDPGFFIDDDGTGYIFFGDGSIHVLTLNSTYSAVVSQTNNVVNSGGEGSHVVKRGGYYYLFNANPGTWPFQLRCSRATNLFGPWETGHICLLGTNGGHQGAIVDIDDNDNWFGFVHQDSDAIGRMTRIGPVFWENDWPVFGTPSNRNVIAATYPKPILGKPIVQPPTSDDFSASTLGLQWQWNHNPDNTKWSLTERPGWLRLRPTQASGFWTARNTLTQKGQGPWSRGEVKFDLQNLEPGDICGFGTLGKYSAHIAVNCDTDGTLFLSMNVLQDTSAGVQTDTRVASVPFESDTIRLRMDLNFQTNTGLLSYSADGLSWISLGGNFPLAFDWATGTFQGEKFAIFCYNPDLSGGYVDVDSFTFSDTLPPPPPRSAYLRIEAEDYDTQSNTQTESCSEGGQNVGFIQNGSYLVFKNIDFSGGAITFNARVASNASGGNIELYLDSLTGPQIGTCAVTNTGGWQTWTTRSCPVSGAAGIHDLFLRFTGGGGYLFNVNGVQFIRYGDMDGNGIVNADDFLEFAGYWLENNCDLDIDGDCVISLNEFAVFARNWLDE